MVRKKCMQHLKAAEAELACDDRDCFLSDKAIPVHLQARAAVFDLHWWDRDDTNSCKVIKKPLWIK